MRTIIIAVLLFFICVAAHGQYNDTIQYYAGATSTGTLNKTNSSTSYVLSNSVKLGIRKKEFGMNLNNSWLYGEQQRKLTNNDFYSTFDVNLYKTLPHFYYWGLANYTSNYSLKINNQYQGGVGVAYNLVDRKNAFLNVSDGLLYESSDIFLSDTIRDVYTTFRNSFRISFRFTIRELLVISGMNFIQNSLSNSDDYIIKSNMALGFKVKKWLTISTTFAYNRFNRTQKETTLFTYGLALEQYF